MINININNNNNNNDNNDNNNDSVYNSAVIARVHSMKTAGRCIIY